MKERKKQSRSLRKIFASLLVLTLVAAAMLYPDGMRLGDEAYAETVSGQVTLTSSLKTLDNTTTDKVKFTVNVGANATEGVSGIQFKVSYPEEFDLVSYTPGGFFDNGVSFFGETTENGPARPFFCGLGSHKNDSGDDAERVEKESGELVTLIFEANTTLDANTSYSFSLEENTTEAFLLAAEGDSNPHTTYYTVVTTDVPETYTPDSSDKGGTSTEVSGETVTVTPATSESGTTTATVKKQAVAKAIEQAKTDTSKTEVVINATSPKPEGSASGEAKNELTLAKESMQDVAEAEKSIQIKTDAGQLTFDKAAAKSIGSRDGGEKLVINTEKKDTVTVNVTGEGSKELDVVQFTVTAKLIRSDETSAEKATEVTSFGGGKVTITLELPTSLQNENNLICWHYTDTNYTVVTGRVEGTKYVFETNHFSNWGVGTESMLMTYAKAKNLSEGVTVSGTVTSYNPKNAVTVKLCEPNGTDAKHTAIVDAASGASGQVTQSFNFANVPAGIYDLVVTKAGHLTYTIKNVVVGSDKLDLTQHSSSAVSNITLLAGDVNGDGSINENDVTVIRYSANINKLVGNASNVLADVNGDGSVNENDVTVVRYAKNINKSVLNCTYNYN